MMSYRIAAIVFAALIFGASAAAAQLQAPLGVWLHSNKRIQVKLAPCGERLCGTIVWLRFPNGPEGLPLKDSKNPDRALRDRPVMGLTVIDGLRRTGERDWTGGRIYNPDDGQGYSSRITIRDNATLDVRAYVFLPAFGETQIWTRVPATYPRSIAARVTREDERLSSRISNFDD